MSGKKGKDYSGFKMASIGVTANLAPFAVLYLSLHFGAARLFSREDDSIKHSAHECWTAYKKAPDTYDSNKCYDIENDEARLGHMRTLIQRPDMATPFLLETAKNYWSLGICKIDYTPTCAARPKNPLTDVFHPFGVPTAP